MQSIESLIQLLGTKTGPKAAASIVAHGKEAIPHLIECLYSINKDTRSSAAWALGELQARESLKELERLMDDSDSDVRWFAQGAIHKINRPPKAKVYSRPAPVRFAKPRQIDVPSRYKATKPQEIARQELPDDVSEAIDSDDALTRALGLRLLFKKDPKHPYIRNTIGKLTNSLGSNNPRSRSWAAVTLSMMGEGAIDALSEALTDDNPTTRMYAAWALGLSLRPDAVAPLLDAIEDVEMAVRAATTVALGHLGDSRSVGRLIFALRDPHWLVREGAARALGTAGDRRAIEHLQLLLKDSDERCRRAAADAIANIDRGAGPRFVRSKPAA